MTRCYRMRYRVAVLLSLAILLPVSFAVADAPAAPAAKGDAMNYRQAKEFLMQHTKVLELTDGGPALSSQTLGMWVFNQAFFSNSRLPGFASAIAMVQFAIVFAIAMVMQHYLRRREAVL